MKVTGVIQNSRSLPIEIKKKTQVCAIWQLPCVNSVPADDSIFLLFILFIEYVLDRIYSLGS